MAVLLEQFMRERVFTDQFMDLEHATLQLTEKQ